MSESIVNSLYWAKDTLSAVRGSLGMGVTDSAIKMSEPIGSKYLNILLLGESLVGKSTFINAFANYTKHEFFDLAKTCEPECVIPMCYTMTDESFNEVTFKIGSEAAAEDVKDYEFTVQDLKVRLIDTPGLSQCKYSFDKREVSKILEHLAKYESLHGIAIVLKSSTTGFSKQFEAQVNHLFTHLGPAAYANIIFIFTHSRTTFYKPGESLGALTKFLVAIGQFSLFPLSKANMFCLDNETFKYLVACQRDIKFSQNEIQSFIESWNVSVNCCKEILNYIAGRNGHSGLQPVKVQYNESVDAMLKVSQDLLGLLTDIALMFEENSIILEQCKAFASDSNSKHMLVPLINLKKIMPTDKCVIICSNEKCVPIAKKQTTFVALGTPEHTRCSCITKQTSCLPYLKTLHFENMMGGDIETKEHSSFQLITKITEMISLIEHEKGVIAKALVMFSKYIRQKSMIDFYEASPSDVSISSMIQSKIEWDVRFPSPFENFKSLYQQYSNTITGQIQEEEISEITRELYDLKYTGKMLAEIYTISATAASTSNQNNLTPGRCKKFKQGPRSKISKTMFRDPSTSQGSIIMGHEYSVDPSTENLLQKILTELKEVKYEQHKLREMTEEIKSSLSK